MTTTHKTQHTPGPWSVDETKALGAYGVWTSYTTHPGYDGAGYPSKVCSVFPETGSSKEVGREQRDANARLIASAPCLLSALRSLLDDSPYASDSDSCECGEDGHGDGGTCCHIQAHRAIAKATGKQ